MSLAAPLLAQGFSDSLARRRGQSGCYQLANGMGAMLDEEDALSRHEWLIAPLLLQGSNSPDARIFQGLAIDIDRLLDAYTQLAEQRDVVEWGESQGTLKAQRCTQIGPLAAAGNAGCALAAGAATYRSYAGAFTSA